MSMILSKVGANSFHSLIKSVRKLLVLEKKTPPAHVPPAVEEQRKNAMEEENKAALFRLAKDEVATAMQIADEAEKAARNVSFRLNYLDGSFIC